jgi:anti-anti-sigma factor
MFDVCRTEEEALASFGWTGESRKPRETLCTLATDRGMSSILMRHVGDVTILDVNGRLVMKTSTALREEMKKLQAAHKKVLLNFENVTSMDSCGLGNWVTAHQEAVCARVQVKYILNQRIRAILKIVKLM